MMSFAASRSTSLFAFTLPVFTLPVLELSVALPFVAVTSPLVLILPLALAITLLSAFTVPLVVMLPPAFKSTLALVEVRLPLAVILFAASMSTSLLAVTLPPVATEPFLELMLTLSAAFKATPSAVVISPSVVTVILPVCSSLYLEVSIVELMVILPVSA